MKLHNLHQDIGAFAAKVGTGFAKGSAASKENRSGLRLDGVASRSRSAGSFHWVIVPPALVTVALLTWMATWAARGFDVTDESFYILWIQDPARFKIGASLFGFILNPIYTVFGGSLAAIRLAGFILIAAAGTGVAWSFLRTVFPLGERACLLRSASFLLIAAGAPLTYYTYWLPTPSYNWLTLLSGLVLAAAFGALLPPARLRLSAVLAGVAGVMAFLARPPSGVAFACFYLAAILIVLAPARGVTMQLLRGAVATAAVLTVTMLFIAPAHLVLEIYKSYFEVFGVENPTTGGSTANLIQFLQSRSAAAYLLVLLMAITATMTRRLHFVVAAFAGLGALAVIYVDTIYAQRFITLGVSVVALTMISIAGCLDKNHQHSPYLRLLILVVLVPWGIVIGTENDLIIHAALSVSLPALAAYLAAFLLPRWKSAVALASAGLLGLTATMLTAGVKNPYRLAAPLWSQTEAVMLTPDLGHVRTDSATKQFILELRRVAAQANFRKGGPLLDLTGYNPGIALILGADPPVVPWLLGGYPFSERLLRTVLDRMPPQDLKAAWVIHSDAPIPFKKDLLDQMGIDLDKDYTLVGSVDHPVDKVTIRLYAPKG